MRFLYHKTFKIMLNVVILVINFLDFPHPVFTVEFSNDVNASPAHDWINSGSYAVDAIFNIQEHAKIICCVRYFEVRCNQITVNLSS